VTAAMRAAFEEDRWPYERNEPWWLAPPYQWALVLSRLAANEHDDLPLSALRSPRPGGRLTVPADQGRPLVVTGQLYWRSGSRVSGRQDEDR